MKKSNDLPLNENNLEDEEDEISENNEEINEDEEDEDDIEDDDDFYNKDYNLEDDMNNKNKESELIKESEEYKEKINKSGVLYISYIPEGLTVALIRHKLKKYGIQRVYLKPLSGKKNHFKEGWVEFENKIMAKLCEYELNGRPIQGKKRDPLSEEMWTFKYLHKFKWYHLIEKMYMKKKEKEQKLKTTLNQAHRESNFIMENMHQSKKKRKRDEMNPDSIDNYRRVPKQIKAIAKK